MKRIILSLILIIIFFVSPFLNAFADRDTATIAVYNASILVKRGDAKIYSITFVASANSGNFAVYDATSLTVSGTDIKAEGSEVTAAGSQFQDFSNKPLELSTGLYLSITDGTVLIRYE